MKVLLPIDLTSDMLVSSTIPEPDTGETLWVSGGSYAVDAQVIRTTTHMVYVSSQAHSGRTALPENDPDYWTPKCFTNRWSAFDAEINTTTVGGSPVTWVLHPGFFNSVAIYGTSASTVDITVKDAPAGSVVFSYSGSFQSEPLDWYDWAFGVYKTSNKLQVEGITPYDTAELTITITPASGTVAKVGTVLIGDMRPLLGEDATWGGTQYGASVEPVTYSYIKTDDYGKTTIKRRHSATNLRAQVVIPIEGSEYALAAVQEALDRPAGWFASDAPLYGDLNVYGLGSGTMNYDSYGRAVLSIFVKGMI